MDSPLDYLPNELLFQILINLKDTSILRFGESCKRFNCLTKSNMIWQIKTQNKYEHSNYEKESEIKDWMEYYKQRVAIDKEAKLLIEKVVSEKDQPSFNKLIKLGNDVIDVIVSFIKESKNKENYQHIETEMNKLIIKINYKQTIKKMRKMLIKYNNDKQCCSIDEGSIIISQYFQPLVDVKKEVNTSFNEIVRKFDEMYEKNYKSNILQKAKFILNFMQKEGYLGNTVNYYDHQNSFLNEVIKNRGIGIPITLSILYKMIADRIGLGQFISFTNFPSHFLLRLDLEENQVMLIDSFNNKILDLEDAKKLIGGVPWRDNFIEPVELKKVWNRQITNLVYIFQRENFALFIDALDLFYELADNIDEQLEISILQLNSCLSVGQYQRAKKIVKRECVAQRIPVDQLRF